MNQINVDSKHCWTVAFWGYLNASLRLIEDKAQQLGIALRDLTLMVDGQHLHGNSERPVFFHAWLAIPDSTLPSKGVGYRRNTNEEKDLKSLNINTFTQTSLWRLQGFSLNEFPKALAESEFCVPSAKGVLVSNDSRRNLTDIQETSQWFAGIDCYEKLLTATLGVEAQTYEKLSLILCFFLSRLIGIVGQVVYFGTLYQ